MHTYNISPKADNNAFKIACLRIENSIKNITKKPVFIDVDGSLIQIYEVSSGIIKVFNDYEVDAVYVDSELDLDSVFK